MKIIVAGAGIVGATTALFLARSGHEVTVLERGLVTGRGATASNAGLLVPNDSLVWATPAAPKTLLQSFFAGEDGFLKVRPSAGPRLIPWGLAFLRNCTKTREKRNQAHTYALSALSVRMTRELVDEYAIDTPFQGNGTVFFFDSPAHRDEGLHERRELTALGNDLRRITPEDLHELDPGFDGGYAASAAAVFAPDSATGDSSAFAQRALQIAIERYGATVRTGIEVRGLLRDGRTVSGVGTDHGDLHADAVVLALGARTPLIARKAGVHLPIVPVKGYSATVPIREGAVVPVFGGVDERSRVAYSRMGEFFRFSSMAEFRGYDERIHAPSIRSLREAGERLVPGALDWSRVQYRTGHRPATPTSTPYVGGSDRAPGLFINAGHGHLGWTQATASAHLIDAAVAGTTAQIDPAPYAVP